MFKGTDRLCKVDKTKNAVLWTNSLGFIRDIWNFSTIYNYRVWVRRQTTFKIINLGGYFFRIGFLKVLHKLIRWLGTYFSKKFVKKSMLELIISFSSLYWISYFLWNYSMIFTNSSNVAFSIKISEIEKDHLFSMIRLILFSQPVTNQLISLHFLSSLFND